MLKIIQRSNPSIVFLAFILIIGVGYSIFRMVAAFSGEEEAPEYRRSPPAAFAVPVPSTLVDAPILEEDRLPDAEYNSLATLTVNLANKVAAQNLKTNNLTKEGMSSDEAKRTLISLNSLYNSVGTSQAQAAEEVILDGATINDAQMSTSFSYLPSQTNAGAEVTVEARFLYDSQDKGGSWNLYTLNVGE